MGFFENMDPDPGLGAGKTLNAKKPQSWKTHETPGYRKKIARLHNALKNKNKFKCKISKIV